MDQTGCELRSLPQRLRILTNFERMDGVYGGRFFAQSKYLGCDTSLIACLRIFRESLSYDAVVLNTETRRLLTLCLLKWLFPFWPLTLVSVDIHLSRPVTLGEKFVAWVKRLLLKRVNRFVLYFKDFGEYARFYGISSSRVVYVPFKVNEWESLPERQSLSSDGSYILTAGRGLRDLPTFINAMKHIPYPAILLYQDAGVMRVYGTELTLGTLPLNVKAVLHDGRQASWIEYIAGAKVVVIPALDSIRPVGISLYLLAMALMKAVVISEGPATRGLLENEAIMVPVGDSESLARAIIKVWEDDSLRNKLAEAGRVYAESLGGEQRLLGDIVDICGDLLSGVN